VTFLARLAPSDRAIQRSDRDNPRNSWRYWDLVLTCPRVWSSQASHWRMSCSNASAGTGRLNKNPWASSQCRFVSISSWAFVSTPLVLSPGVQDPRSIADGALRWRGGGLGWVSGLPVLEAAPPSVCICRRVRTRVGVESCGGAAGPFSCGQQTARRIYSRRLTSTRC